MFLICKVNNNFLETIIRAPVNNDRLMGRFITNVAYVSSSELEELGMGSFLTLKEILFMRFSLSDVENGIQCRFHDLLGLGGDFGVFLQNDFLHVLSFSMEFYFAPLIDDFSEIETFQGLSRV